MSLSKWKELAAKKTNTGQMKRNLYDEITEERIRSKTTDQAIAKTFRLDKLDQIAEQTKPKKRVRFQVPRVNREGGIDYAPEVDPYEDMDVDGLLNLEDYVAPQAEKQIAKIPKEPPKYEMDPSFWQIPDDPPPPEYESLFPPAIEAPPEEGEDEDDEGEDEGEAEAEGEVKYEEANKVLDGLGIPNYDDVEMRLAEPEMNDTKRKKYLRTIVNNAERRRKEITPQKSKATRDYKAGRITLNEKNLIHREVGKLEKEIKSFRHHYENKIYTYKGSGLGTRKIKRGSGAFFFNNAKEMLQKLTLIIAEMKAGNTSLDMRNMGVTILDALLHAKHINKSQYQKLVKKHFA